MPVGEEDSLSVYLRRKIKSKESLFFTKLSLMPVELW